MLDKAEYSAFQSTLNSAIVSYRIYLSVISIQMHTKTMRLDELVVDYDAVIEIDTEIIEWCGQSLDF